MGFNNLQRDQRKNHRGQMKLAFDQLLPSFFKISTQIEDTKKKELKPYPRVIIKRLTQRETDLLTKRKRVRSRPRVISSENEFEPDSIDELNCTSQPLDSSGSSCDSLPDLREIPTLLHIDMNNDKNSKLSDRVDAEVLKRITHMKQEEGMPNASAMSRSFIRDLASDSPNQKEKTEFNQTFNRIFEEIREDKNSREKSRKQLNVSSNDLSKNDLTIQDDCQKKSDQSTVSISHNKNLKLQKKPKSSLRGESSKNLEENEGTNSINNSKSPFALKKAESCNNNSKSLTLKKDEVHPTKSAKSLYSPKAKSSSNNSKSLALKNNESSKQSKSLALKKDELQSNATSKSVALNKDESHSNNVSKSLAVKKDKPNDTLLHMVSVPSEALTQFTNYSHSKIERGIQTNEEIAPQDDSLFSQSLDFVLKSEKNQLDKNVLKVSSVENLLTLGTILNNWQRILKEHRGKVEQEKEEKIQKLKKKYDEKCEKIDSCIESYSKMERELMYEKSRLYNGQGLSQEFMLQMEILLKECSNQEDIVPVSLKDGKEASEPKKENSLSYCNISESTLANENKCSNKITSQPKSASKSGISITPVSTKDSIQGKCTTTTVASHSYPISHPKGISIQLIPKEDSIANNISTPIHYENTSLVPSHSSSEIFTPSGKLSYKSVGQHISSQGSKAYRFEKHSQVSGLNSDYSPAFKRIRTSIENNFSPQNLPSTANPGSSIHLPSTANPGSSIQTMNIEQVKRSDEHKQKVISPKLSTTSINQSVGLSQPKLDKNSKKVNLSKPAVIRTIPEANFDNFGKIQKDVRSRVDPKSSMRENKSKTPNRTSNPAPTLQSTLKETPAVLESVSSQASKSSVPIRFSPSSNLNTSNISTSGNAMTPITKLAPLAPKRDYTKPQISVLHKNKSQGNRYIDVKIQSKEFQKPRNTKLLNIQPMIASQPPSQTIMQTSTQTVLQPSSGQQSSQTLSQPQFTSLQGQPTVEMLGQNYQIICPPINQSNNSISSLSSTPIIFTNTPNLSGSLPQGSQFQTSQHSSPRFQLHNHPPPTYTESMNPTYTYQSSQQPIQPLLSTGILPHLINPLIPSQCIVNPYINSHQSISQENTLGDSSESSYSQTGQCSAKNSQSQEGLGIIIESTTSISDFDNPSNDLPADPSFDIASESCFLCGDSAQVFCCGQFFYCGEKCKETDRARHQEECQTNK